MEPEQRMMTIRLLEKISLNREVAEKLQISDISGYRKEEKNENINKKQR